MNQYFNKIDDTISSEPIATMHRTDAAEILKEADLHM